MSMISGALSSGPSRVNVMRRALEEFPVLPGDAHGPAALGVDQRDDFPC